MAHCHRLGMTGSPKLTTLAGLTDTASASAATFLAGIVATRVLSNEALGGYSLVFSVAVLASTIPTQLLLVPSQARLMELSPIHRVSALGRTLRIALVTAGVGSLLVLGAYYVSPSLPGSTRFALVASGALYSAMAPLQQHVRTVFHLGLRHWTASMLSFIRFVIVSTLIASGLATGIPPAFVPLGALGIADLLVVGLALGVTMRERVSTPLLLDRKRLALSGRWLLAAAALGPAAGFGVSLAVAHFAGVSQLGFAEAARISAQPVLVLATGLAAVARPSVMRAAQDRRRQEAVGVRLRFQLSLTLGGAAYALALLLPAGLNPIRALIPAAFDIPGLALLSVAAAMINGSALLHRSELVAVDMTGSITSAEMRASIIRVVAGASASVGKAWTVPLSFLLGGIVRFVTLSRRTQAVYDERSREV